MSFTTGPVFTTAGKELHARAIAGEQLKFTTMKLGDGNLGSTSIPSLTSLINAVTSVPIATMRHSGDFAVISGMFTNADLTTGFYWREIGLFAADPAAPNDRSRDILYCYQNAGSLADYIPASNSELIKKRINVAAIVSDAANVSATISDTTSADMVTFDNANSGLDADDVQAALDELAIMIQNIDVDAYSQKETDDLLKNKADLGANGKVPSSQLPEISSAKTFTATLKAQNWGEGADGRFTTTTLWSNFPADAKVVIVDVDLSNTDLDEKIAYLEAWESVSANEVEQMSLGLRFYAWEAPTVDIPINVGVL